MLATRCGLLACITLLTGCPSLLLSALEHLTPGEPVIGGSGLVSVSPANERWIRDAYQEEAAGEELALLRDTGDAVLGVSVYSASDYPGPSSEVVRVFNPDTQRDESPDIERFAARVGAERYGGACGRIKLSWNRACDFAVEVRLEDEQVVLFEGFTSALTRGGRADRIAELGELVASAVFRPGEQTLSVARRAAGPAEAGQTALASASLARAAHLVADR